ncbi:MAG: dUTP diphosphatase [Muribaculaceae bacterium]
MKVKIKKLYKDATIPSYSLDGDAGMDLTAVSKYYGDFGNIVYGTGIAIEIPDGYVGLIFPRSSICNKYLHLINCVGVIDSNYRGEITIKFSLRTFKNYEVCNCRDLEDYKIGDRIGQIIIMPYPDIEFEEVKELSKTERGDKGYGSTGE